MNPLIFKTAATLAATWFEAALSSGLPRGKYVGMGDKPLKMFVEDHLEKFLPLTISYLLEMLKPHSNCNEHMRAEIYEALMDPINDPELMDMGKSKTKKEHEDLVQKAIRDFDKRKVFETVGVKPVDAKPTNLTKNDLLGSTSLH